MIINVLGKLSGAQQFKIFQRLPAVFHRIKGGVENNAVRVQMRVEGTRGVVLEQGGHEIAGQTFVAGTSNADSGRGKSLKYFQGCLNGPFMRLKNPVVIAQERRQ